MRKVMIGRVLGLGCLLAVASAVSLAVALRALAQTYVEVTPAASGVIASASDSNLPGNTVDKNLSTYWSGRGDGVWIRYDLGSTRTVGYVKVAFQNGSKRRYRFDVQVSADATVWTTVWTGQSSGATTALETFDFADVDARYVRYLGHGSTTNLWNSLTEVEIWAAGSPPPPPPPPPPFPSFCAAYPQIPGPGQWQSSRAFLDGSGKLVYPADASGNRLPDFSYAGYRYGQVALPVVPEVARLGPGAGDQTVRIQQALDAVGARTPDASGIRGALVLDPGVYEIAGTLHVNHSGVVLRGSGDGADPSVDTILRITGDTPHQRPAVVLGTNSTSWTASATRTDITTAFVQVGSKSFDVASTADFVIGDSVLIRHPSTQAWIDAVDCGGLVNEGCWAAGSKDLIYYRRITAMAGNTVTLDAPIYNHLDRSLSQSTMAKVSANFITESGVEDLRVDIVTLGGEDENHAWNGINVVGAHDSWVRNITALHFGYAGVQVNTSVRITVADSAALDPVGIRTGGRFYNFVADHRAQLVLFTNCHLTGARHGYVTNGTTDINGVVFHRSSANGGADMEAGHRHWQTGILMDNIVESGTGTVKLINRGDFGTQHGWGCAHSVSWRFNKATQVQQPPTAQNYAITDIGTFSTSYPWPGPTGFQEKQTGTLVPTSLYEAQLCERLRWGAP